MKSTVEEMPHKADKNISKSNKSDGDSDVNQDSLKNNDQSESQESNGEKSSEMSSGKLSNSNNSQGITWTTLPADLENKILDLTGPIQCEAKVIRKEDPVDWSPYYSSDIITPEDYDFLVAFQVAQSEDERDSLIEFYKDKAFVTFREIVKKVSDVNDLKKILVVIDDMLWENEERVEYFNLEETSPWNDFMHLLNSSNEFVRNLSSRIISIMMACSRKKPEPDDLQRYLEWLKDELMPENQHLQSVARCLQRLLRKNLYRKAFMNISGIQQIVRVLSYKMITQSQYQLTFCLWVTSLNPLLAEKMNRTGLIPVLSEILHSCPIEIVKLPRIIIATFRNLLEKPREVAVRRHNGLVMIQCRVVSNLSIIESKIMNSGDPECIEDYEYVKGVLATYVQQMNSFEEYCYEIKSRRLEWSDVHTSKKFWSQNAERLNEKDFEIIKILLDILEKSVDVVVLTVAAHDLQEYMKAFSRGKKVVEGLGGKNVLVKLLTKHKHPKVREQALKTLQILMLDNHHLFVDYAANNRLTLDEADVSAGPVPEET